MLLLHPDGRFMDMNASFCMMLGYTEEELLGKTFLDITHPDDIAASKEWIGSLLNGHTVPLHIEKRYLHKDGNEVWGIVSTKLLRHNDGTPRYFVTHVHDITERKAAEEEKKEA